ncbi:MAG: hypothetical protein AAF437_03720 [Pseudomonadota bacterium]
MKAESITVEDAVSTVKIQSKNTALIVLGMHRSGTSALTRVLNIMGCDLPKTLLGANESNEEGHWESDKGRELNNDVLASAGSNWQDWTQFNPDWYNSPKYNDYKQRLISTISNEYPERGLVVLKDPRICKLLPLWTDALTSMDVRPLNILCLRHPVEVAASLAKRNGILPASGFLIWLRYVLEAEYASRSLPRTIIGYERLLSNWSDCIEQIASDLNVTFPKTIGKATPEIGRFLNPELRHQDVAHEKTIVAFGKDSWAARAWSVFERWLKDGERSEDFDELDSIRRSLNECQPVFEQIVAVSQRDYSTQKQLQSLQDQLQSVEDEHAAKVSELNEIVREQNEELQLRSQRFALQEDETRNLNDAYEHVLTKLDEAQRDKANLEHEMSSHRARSVEHEKLGAALQAANTKIRLLSDSGQEEKSKLKVQIEKLEHARAEKQSEVSRLTRAVEQTAQELRAEKANSTNIVKDLRQQVGHREQRISDLAGRLEAEKSNSSAKIKDLRQQVNHREQRVTDLMGRLDDSKARIARLTSLANQRNEQISDREQTVKTLLRKVSGLEHVSAELSGLISILLKTMFANRDLPIVHDRRVKNYAEFIEAVGILDPDWYAERNPDVKTSKLDPSEHFVRYGAREGRAPSAKFSRK